MVLMSGNEAIARGAYESGVVFASAYPGTPSTEILENMKNYDGVYSEWSPNEKVALEVGVGAAYAGARALVAMKHVGVNVAADPLFTLSYTGVRGGLVIVSADDPELHSSQNEQDNRNYAKFAKIPMLDPSDSQEAKDFVRLAFDISEKFDTPVFLRTTTRISHSKSPVKISPADRDNATKGIAAVKDPEKLVMLPNNARKRHVVVEKRLDDLREFANDFTENRIEEGKGKTGIVTSGISYQYAKELFPNAPILKLGMIYPLPEKIIREFVKDLDEVVVIEELDPFFEEQIKAMGIEAKGKEFIPILGELNLDIVESSGLIGTQGPKLREPVEIDLPKLPPRPPNMCPGCPHRGVFYELSKKKVFVTGDIGCYTLAFLPPLRSIDTCLCMGASIGHAIGMDKVLSMADHEKGEGGVVAVIGDSTFFHSGITGLMDAAYNRSGSTIIILDNRTTAMTGAQDNPGTGRTLMGDETNIVDVEALAKALGIKRLSVIDPYDLDNTSLVISNELKSKETSLIISRGPCVLLRGAKRDSWKQHTIDVDKCTGCKACLKLGCPALGWAPDELNSKGKEGRAVIDRLICIGCGVCTNLCKFDAIVT
ncbi:MAG: indolepyruvate ferredoxin oxidoreductase subunit alpha [Deltaproteobacteria bacterium]|uniref:Indolepyruvate oxidoreductase subunit IorA n=1 Tax=Candidatus Zymogenus saltonus TaxID=2844893 RepID=A0A9D8KFJ8_9DELT|nr:indolepyruvate ferredoxin oxidoreductase subunit alpha [Candidatus Zymogenus saltonus]